ncbi:hypothetical protein IGK30_000318 [Enterococcus sp. AZ178]|uniref:hypothetical protein n=1 Tax=Enterococcus sp. AZ178 TaxID=2774822 RepID=UPI003F271895
MSLVYNNKKLIGKCSKYAIEKVQGASPFVMLENFEPKQPQLNENQQIVLEYLKGMCPAKLGVSAMVTAYCLVDDNINDNWQEYSDEIPEHIEALQELSVAEENQVLEVFANWALEQEEE